MGILGNLAGNLADMALDAIQNASLQNAVMAGIVFDHTKYGGLSIDIGFEVLEAIGKCINVRTNINKGKTWDFYVGTSEDGGNAFVIQNKDIVVRYSVLVREWDEPIHYGIEFFGKDAGILAQKVVSILDSFDCSNIHYVWEPLPFQFRYWINSVEPNLEEDTSDEDLKKFLKSQGLKKHGDIFIKGDLKDLGILMTKWKNIFEENNDLSHVTSNMFDKNKLYIDEKMREEKNVTSITDGTSAISYYCDSANEVLGYFKNQSKKSLMFQYVEDIDYSYMQMLFTDETIPGSLESIVLVPENIEISDLEIFLEEIEDSGIEVPNSFSDYFNNFKETLRILEETLKSNERTESGSDDLGDFLDNLTDKLENAFNVLELDEEEDTTLEDVKKAYRNLSKEFHPDKMSGLTPKMRQIAEAKMQELNEAYEFLCKYFEMTDSDDDIGD